MEYINWGELLRTINLLDYSKIKYFHVDGGWSCNNQRIQNIEVGDGVVEIWPNISPENITTYENIKLFEQCNINHFE